MEPIPLQKLSKIDFGGEKSPLEVIVFHVAQMICSAEKQATAFI